MDTLAPPSVAATPPGAVTSPPSLAGAPRLAIWSPDGAWARADRWLGALSPANRDALAATAQRRASSLGLRRGDDPIPLVLTPASLPRPQLDQLGAAARVITSALVKTARQLIETDPARAGLLFHHLSPLELEALRTRWQEAEDLLVARIDWFIDGAGRARALEVNATIPAMQVYSDVAVRGWLAAVSPAQTDALLAQGPRNSVWLAEAILAAGRAGGRSEPFDIQILHREADPQRSELVAIAGLLQARGHAARTCTPADVILDGAPNRLLYRHLFARGVEAGTPVGRAFLDPVRHGMWNRVDGWLETKGLFAELSLRASRPGGPLSAEERQVVADWVPWTRLLDDVADAELGDGDAFILKRSHDYGGKSVVIGREVGPAAFRAALVAARGDSPGSWVAQGLVDAPAIDRWTCVPGAAAGAWQAVRAPLHLDISTYASLVAGVPLGGSVCRAAPGLIVNIVGGGGVAPLFPDDQLDAALRAIVPAP